MQKLKKPKKINNQKAGRLTGFFIAVKVAGQRASQFESGNGAKWEENMLTINVDSYVTLEEADKYVEDNYTEFDDLAVLWGVLSPRDKEAYLRYSLGQLESLVLQGAPLYPNQDLQFPRRECFKPATKENPIVPTEIKEAQIENALALFNKDICARADEQMKTLGTLGAMKNIKYNKREMGEVGLGASLTGAVVSKRLESAEAEKFIKAWL